MSLNGPVDAFWNFVDFVNYRGDWDRKDSVRLAEKYTLSEIWMFKEMYNFYFDQLL